MRPPSPVTALKNMAAGKFGAKAVPNRPAVAQLSPMSRISLLPWRSEKYPATKAMNSQTNAVIVLSWPATATSTFKSLAIDTSSGPTMNTTSWIMNIPDPVIEIRNQNPGLLVASEVKFQP
jgi:hypothetical protein